MTKPTLRSRFAVRAALLTLALSLALSVGSVLFWQSRVKQAIENGVADHLGSLEAELAIAGDIVTTRARPIILPSSEQFAQVLSLDGSVLATSAELAGSGPTLSAEVVTAAAPDDYIAEVTDPRTSAGRALLRARVFDGGAEPVIGIVGSSLAGVASSRARALAVLGGLSAVLSLLIGGGVWLAVTYALRPVTLLAQEADEKAHTTGPWELLRQADTEELQSLTDSMNGLLSQISAAFEHERQFLDDASHELRTPIAVARGELDLLRAEAEDDARLLASVASSIEELDRLDRLAADLLLLARARGSGWSSTHECDLAGVARRAAAHVVRANGSVAHVVVTGEAAAWGDERALERTLVNLIGNSVTYGSRDVSVTLQRRGPDAVITVIDDGPGFPADVLQDPFTRFAKPRGAEPHGAGLGLAIASAIVRAHGGSIQVHNRAEGGAAVEIALPGPPHGESPGTRAPHRAPTHN